MTFRRTVVIGILAAMAGCQGNDEPAPDDEAGRTGPQVNGRELDSAFPLVLEEDGEKIADVHYHPDGHSHWHQQPLELVVDRPREIVATVYDADVDPISLGEEYRLVFDPPSDVVGERLEVEIDGRDVTVTAVEAGEARLRFALYGPEEDPWVTPDMRTEATRA